MSNNLKIISPRTSKGKKLPDLKELTISKIDNFKGTFDDKASFMV